MYVSHFIGFFIHNIYFDAVVWLEYAKKRNGIMLLVYTGIVLVLRVRVAQKPQEIVMYSRKVCNESIKYQYHLRCNNRIGPAKAEEEAHSSSSFHISYFVTEFETTSLRRV